MNGIVLIDKPSGMTSHDVVNRWRRLANDRRVGHAGTLDPMATGLLLLLNGSATRLAQFFSGADKTYEAEITFGLTSDSYDITGDLVASDRGLPDQSAVVAALAAMTGSYWQRPPAISAKKIAGVAAYKLARQNRPVELSPVEVELKSVDVLAQTDRTLALRLHCSAGFYVRSMAHELGEKLGCGGVLSALRRTGVGAFSIQQATTLEQAAELGRAARLGEVIIPAAASLPELPCEHFGLEVTAQIRNGRAFRTSPFVVPQAAPYVRALSHQNELIAIGELIFPNLYRPKIVL